MSAANSEAPLDEQHVMNGFHAFLANALAQAKAERLLDADTLASAEADLMVAGKQISPSQFQALSTHSVHLRIVVPVDHRSRTCAMSILRCFTIKYDTSQRTDI